MAEIGIKDIVALAKAGYKYSEVKELITLANQSEAPAPEDETKDQAKKTEQHEDGKEQPNEAPKNATETPSDDEATLLYKKRIEELEDQVKNLQSENVHKDRSDVDEKSDEETLDDITRLFM